jgi:N-acetylneuraminate epimerase
MKRCWIGLCLFFQTLRAEDMAWAPLPALPDAEGFAGAFAGVSHGALLVAGGANFPDKMPWEGGTKVWHDSIFILHDPAVRWEKAGKLPKPNGYGVSLTDAEGLICIGGGDATRHFSEVFRIECMDGQVKTTALPALPKACAMMSGAISGRKIYISGGMENPADTSALADFLMLDLDHIDEGWQVLPPCPGPARILATMGVLDDVVFVFSGAALKPGPDGKAAREWLKDAWKYKAEVGWQRLADLPRAAVAAPSPAPMRDGRLLVLGGDDGALIHFEPKEKHPGFPRDVLAYDWAKDHWSEQGELPFSLVTTPCVLWHGKIVIPGGEARPGKRSPQVWRLEK